jgi:hypothetical protein
MTGPYSQSRALASEPSYPIPSYPMYAVSSPQAAQSRWEFGLGCSLLSSKLRASAAGQYNIYLSMLVKKEKDKELELQRSI